MVHKKRFKYRGRLRQLLRSLVTRLDRLIKAYDANPQLNMEPTIFARAQLVILRNNLSSQLLWKE